MCINRIHNSYFENIPYQNKRKYEKIKKLVIKVLEFLSGIDVKKNDLINQNYFTFLSRICSVPHPLMKDIISIIVSNQMHLQRLGINISFAFSFQKTSSSFEDSFFKNNKVHIFTNEKNERESIEKLRTLAPVGNLFFGTSGLSSLNLASVRPSIQYIMIMDVSNCTKLFWKKMKKLIRNHSRIECIKKIEEHILQKFQDYGLKKSSCEISAKKLMHPTSWLSDDQRYEKIQSIFKKRQFVFLHADFQDSNFVKKMKKKLSFFQLKIDVFYSSNIINFILLKNLSKYQHSLEYLLSENTIIVDTEEQPFKITKILAYQHSTCSLQNSITYPFDYGFVQYENIQATQRVRERGNQPVADLYPILKVAKIFAVSELVYQFGLFQKYYTEEEMDQVMQEISYDNFNTTSELEKATAHFLYEKNYC